MDTGAESIVDIGGGWHRPAWQQLAACRGLDPELFFQSRGKPHPEAIEACKGCKVAEDCLDYALNNNEPFGVWGGQSRRQFRQLRKALIASVPEEIGRRGSHPGEIDANGNSESPVVQVSISRAIAKANSRLASPGRRSS